MTTATHPLALALFASLFTAACVDRPACAPCGPTPACVGEPSAATASNAAPSSAAPSSALPSTAPAVPESGAQQGDTQQSFEPQAASSPAPAAQASVVQITVTRSGALSLDGASVTAPDQLVSLLRAAKERDPELRAIVAADQNATHGAVMAVVDALESAGVTRIAFAVAPPAGAAPPPGAPR